MKNIVYNGDKYSNIFKLDNNILLKYSEQNKDNWKYLIEHKKELPFLNIPTKVEDLDDTEKTIYETSCDSKTKIYLPYLKDYNTLFNESCEEGLVADLFLNLKQIKSEDKNLSILKESRKITESIIYKVQELELKI